MPSKREWGTPQEMQWAFVEATSCDYDLGGTTEPFNFFLTKGGGKGVIWRVDGGETKVLVYRSGGEEEKRLKMALSNNGHVGVLTEYNDSGVLEGVRVSLTAFLLAGKDEGFVQIGRSLLADGRDLRLSLNVVDGIARLTERSFYGDEGRGEFLIGDFGGLDEEGGLVVSMVTEDKKLSVRVLFGDGVVSLVLETKPGLFEYSYLEMHFGREVDVSMFDKVQTLPEANEFLFKQLLLVDSDGNDEWDDEWGESGWE